MYKGSNPGGKYSLRENPWAVEDGKYLKLEDIQNPFKETIIEFMENGLEAELDNNLSYGKYDYKDKNTNNSCNGHSSKMLRTSFGEVCRFSKTERRKMSPTSRISMVFPLQTARSSGLPTRYCPCPISGSSGLWNPSIRWYFWALSATMFAVKDKLWKRSVHCYRRQFGWPERCPGDVGW